jgi:hypothetical protein
MGTGRNPKESATEKTPPCLGRVRVKRRGKSPPAFRRLDGLANPIRCKAKEGITRQRDEDCPSFNPGRPQEVHREVDPERNDHVSFSITEPGL